MADSIRISNPEEVMRQVTRSTAVLAVYHEALQKDLSEFSALEELVDTARQTVVQRRSGLLLAIEQVKQQSDSPAAQKALRQYQAKAARYDAQLSTLGQCASELLSTRQDTVNMISDSAQLADTGEILSQKVNRVISSITEAK